VVSQARSWGRTTLRDGSARFCRSSLQRGWITSEEGRVLEDVFVNDAKQTIYFLGLLTVNFGRRLTMSTCPSEGGNTFLRNHADGIASMDLFIVPTISFRLLSGFLILQHSRRELLWLGVTARPSAHWIARQLTERGP
jgi:hypothetical protein